MVSGTEHPDVFYRDFLENDANLQGKRKEETSTSSWSYN